MKATSIVTGFSVMIFLLCGCTRVRDSQSTDPYAGGDYLGQKEPGRIAELFAPGIISTGAHDMSIVVSPDLKEIYVSRSSLNWNSSIVCFKNTGNAWSPPVLPSFIEGLGDAYPFISFDNRTMYFNSTRPLPGDDHDEISRKIWTSERSGGKWSSPLPLDDSIAPSVHMTFPSVSIKGTVYFNSTLENGLGQSDIYCMVKTGSGYSRPENLGPAVNSEYAEFHPFVSPDEDYLMFDTIRPGGSGSNDINISFRKSNGGWTDAVNLGVSVNTEYAEMRPYVSPDGKFLFFCSTRPNPQASLDQENPLYEEFSKIVDGPGNGSQDIYWMDSSIIDELRPAN